jgi:hypothetical protein
MECQTHAQDLDGNNIFFVFNDIELYKITFTQQVNRTLTNFEEIFLIYDFPCFNYLDPTGMVRTLCLRDKPLHKYVEMLKRKII